METDDLTRIRLSARHFVQQFGGAVEETLKLCTYLLELPNIFSYFNSSLDVELLFSLLYLGRIEKLTKYCGGSSG